MLDTVNFNFTDYSGNGSDLRGKTACCLDNVYKHVGQNGNVFLTGNLGSLGIMLTECSVRITKGSLCKWSLGDNWQAMGRSDTKLAIERLSDELHLPFSQVDITRIDVGANIITRYPVETYLDCLGTLRNFKRLEQPHGLLYKANTYELNFYDKIREQKCKGEKIPDLYIGRNVLRYELRLLSRIRQTLGVERVTGEMLYDEDFYISLLDMWLAKYKNIEKEREITLNFASMTNTKEMHKFGIVALVERAGSLYKFISGIKKEQKKGVIVRQRAYDMIKEAREILSEGNMLATVREEVEELDRKTSERILYYR